MILHLMRLTWKTGGATFLCVILLTGVAVSPASAEQCLRVESVPPLATVTLKGAAYHSVVTPGEYCSLEPGRTYRLVASLSRFESRGLKLRYPEGEGDLRLAGDRIARLGRSLLVPGWGQSSLGYAANAAESFLAVAGAGVKVLRSYEHYRTSKDNLEIYRQRSDAAAWTPAEAAAVADVRLHQDYAELHRDHVRLIAGVAAWAAVGNLIETYLMSVPPDAEVRDDGTLELKIPARSGFRAAIRSLFFPGLGQKYNGDHGRALVYQFGTMTSALFAADYWLEYRLDDRNYEAAMARFAEASDAGEAQAARDQADGFAEARDSKRRDMYIYAAGAGSLWLLSVLDAAVRGGAPRKNAFGFEMSHVSGTTWGTAVLQF